MRRVFIAALASLLFWSQAAVCLAQSPPRASKPDADALAAALRLASGLGPDSSRDYVLVLMSQTYARAGRFDEAVRAASLVATGWERAAAFADIADRLAEAGKLDRAAELVNEVLLTIRRAGENDFDATSAYTLNSIVAGAQRWDLEAYPPRQKTVRGTLARLVEAGRADEAANVTSHVKSIALEFEMDEEAQARLFANAARLYRQAGDAAKAEEAFADASAAARRIESDFGRVIALCELAEAYAATGERKRAELTLAEAKQSASTLEGGSGGALQWVVRAYTNAKFYEQAREAAGELSEEDGARAFATLAAFGPESKPSDFEAALSNAFGAALSFEEEGSLARSLEGLASTYGARSPDALSKIAEAVSRLRGPASRAEALIVVGDGHSEAGRKEAAREVWRQALQSAREIRLERSDLHAGDSRMNDGEKLNLLFALARRFARSGSHELAREVVRDVEEVRARALQLSEGKPAHAAETGPRLAELALTLLRAGQRADALEVLESASREASKGGRGVYEHERVNSLGAVAAAYAKAGERARAEQHFRRALEAAQAIEFDDGPDALGVLTNVGSHYAEADMKPDAGYLKALRRLVRRAEEEIE